MCKTTSHAIVLKGIAKVILCWAQRLYLRCVLLPLWVFDGCDRDRRNPFWPMHSRCISFSALLGERSKGGLARASFPKADERTTACQRNVPLVCLSVWRDRRPQFVFARLGRTDTFDSGAGVANAKRHSYIEGRFRDRKAQFKDVSARGSILGFLLPYANVRSVLFYH